MCLVNSAFCPPLKVLLEKVQLETIMCKALPKTGLACFVVFFVCVHKFLISKIQLRSVQSAQVIFLLLCFHVHRLASVK